MLLARQIRMESVKHLSRKSSRGPFVVSLKQKTVRIRASVRFAQSGKEAVIPSRESDQEMAAWKAGIRYKSK